MSETTHCPKCGTVFVRSPSGCVCPKCPDSRVFPKVRAATLNRLRKAEERERKLATLPIAKRLLIRVDGALLFSVQGRPGLWQWCSRIGANALPFPVTPGHLACLVDGCYIYHLARWYAGEESLAAAGFTFARRTGVTDGQT